MSRYLYSPDTAGYSAGTPRVQYLRCAADSQSWLWGAGRLEQANAINMDIDSFPQVDVIADGHYLPFADNVFSVVYMGAVIEHLKYPWLVAAEVYRILKPGGHILVTVPFIYPYHNMPGDYYRFTDQGLEVIFQPCVTVETGIGRHGSGVLIELLKSYASAWFTDERRAEFAAALISIHLHTFKQVSPLSKQPAI